MHRTNLGVQACRVQKRNSSVLNRGEIAVYAFKLTVVAPYDCTSLNTSSIE